MNVFFKLLSEHQIIDQEEQERIKQTLINQPVVLHFELLSCLYIGILMFVGGLSMLVYKNIDHIGHLAIILALMLSCVVAYIYSIRNVMPYSNNQVQQKNIFFDYVVLLACLLLPVVLTYLQVQYHIVGYHVSLISLISSLALFFCAYYFDHIGVLGLAITALASWFGLSITPLQLLQNFNYDSNQLTLVAIFFGLLLYGLNVLTIHKNIKKHFSETYKNIGIHLFFIAGCFAIWDFGNWSYLFMIILLLLSYGLLKEAMTNRSFYYFAAALIYGYFYAVSLIIKLSLLANFNEFVILVLSLIIPVIAGSFIYLLIKYYKLYK